MGKATRWFRGLLGLKKSEPLSPPALNSDPTQPSPKRKWSFVKSSRELTKDHHIHSKSAGERIRSRGGAPPQPRSLEEERHDPSKHTISMAKAAYTVPAANDTDAVVRLTSGGRSASNDAVNTVVVDVNNSGFRNREEWAAIKLQSHFRAYFSRRALRALKALVKLQALVRGHIVRKQYVERLRCMQAILRAQTRAHVRRAQIHESSHATIKSTHSHHPDPATPEKSEHSIRKSTKHEQSFIFKRNGSISNGGVVTDKESVRFHYSMDEGSWEKQVYSTTSGLANEEKSDKILEINIGKPHITPKRRNHLQSSLYPSTFDPKSNRFTTSKETIYQIIPSPSSYEVQSLSSKNNMDDVEETSFCTAQNSPQFYSALSKGGSSMRAPFTPIKSDASRSCLSRYSYYPSYMSCTASSRAKVRSLSAPKQRPQLEKSSATKRFSVHGGYGEQKFSSALHANFTNKAYPGSGRLDRLGMPIGADGVGYSGGLWYKY